MDRLKHDVAFACTETLLEIVDVKPGHRAEVFFDFYQRVKLALDAFEEQQRRERHRLNPSLN
jgi:hypothetical protein